MSETPKAETPKDTGNPEPANVLSNERIVQNFKAVQQMCDRINAEYNGMRERSQQIELKLAQVQQEMLVMKRQLTLVLSGTVATGR